MVKIAVYAIAKNEAKHVKRWVDATQGADVRIVLDTGSEDNTHDLLQKYPIEAHRATLSDFRFDVARNMALDLVPADVDVCVSLDMDEIPDPDFFDLIREGWKPDTGRAWVMWDTGNIWANNLRVHARHGYRWKYPCHEVTESTTGVDNSIVVESAVRHVPDNDKPRSGYLTLLELGHQEDPTDHRMIVYLAREYYFKGMWQELIDVGKKLEDIPGWNVERAQTWRGIGEAYCKLGNDREGLYWYQRNVEEAPNDLEAWMPLAFYYYERKMWQHCYQAAIKVTELSNESYNHYVADQSMPWRMYDLLGIACWNLNKKGSAKRYSRKAAELNPEDKRLAENYQFIVLSVAKDYKEKINA
jgi:glycosyltransferase involved in cell wall biosynthesis